MDIQQQVIKILGVALSLPETRQLQLSDGLWGELPEFDSMSVVNILTRLEDEYGFIIDDDEIEAEIFMMVANVVAFVKDKIAQSQ